MVRDITGPLHPCQANIRSAPPIDLCWFTGVHLRLGAAGGPQTCANVGGLWNSPRRQLAAAAFLRRQGESQAAGEGLPDDLAVWSARSYKSAAPAWPRHRHRLSARATSTLLDAQNAQYSRARPLHTCGPWSASSTNSVECIIRAFLHMRLSFTPTHFRLCIF